MRVAIFLRQICSLVGPSRGALLAILIVSLPNTAGAQDVSEQNALFQRMVLNPANHDVTFEFARVASARGDYEAAIGALERLLYYNPRLTRVKYEIGALYFRLGSYAMARRYFKEALQSPDLDPTTRQRIETYLPDAEKQTQSSRLSGFVQTGVRYQTNGNYVPVDNTLRLGGTDLTLLPTAQKRSDVNAFELAGISHDYDLGTRGDALETRFAGYLTQQARLSQLDIGLFRHQHRPAIAAGARRVAGCDHQALRRRRQHMARQHVVLFERRGRRVGALSPSTIALRSGRNSNGAGSITRTSL